MIIVMGTVQCDPAHAELYAQEARLVVEATRAEPGCLEYCILAESLSEGSFVAVERWDSEAALASHLQTSHVARFAANTSAIMRAANFSKYDALNQRPLF